MSKKTVTVESLKIAINEVLKTSTCSSDIRQGQMNVLENVLHSTGNYHGFQYLSKDKVPEGELPGINWEVVIANGPYEDKFKNTDPTRVYYL